MRFTVGDRVRHRGLKFISGVVMDVTRIPDADMEDDRSYFCKVQLRNGQFYSDRATEWEPTVEPAASHADGSEPEGDDQIYMELG